MFWHWHAVGIPFKGPKMLSLIGTFSISLQFLSCSLSKLSLMSYFCCRHSTSIATGHPPSAVVGQWTSWLLYSKMATQVVIWSSVFGGFLSKIMPSALGLPENPGFLSSDSTSLSSSLSTSSSSEPSSLESLFTCHFFHYHAHRHGSFLLFFFLFFFASFLPFPVFFMFLFFLLLFLFLPLFLFFHFVSTYFFCSLFSPFLFFFFNLFFI